MNIDLAIKKFKGGLPYLEAPYNSRSRGNNLHSLCSYQGKLKPAIAFFLIKYFTKEGDNVFDPFAGVGTIPFEAIMNNRIGIGMDLNPVAYLNTKAKISKIDDNVVMEEIGKLSDFIEKNKNKVKYTANLKINGKLEDYYHPETFKEILSAREYLKKFDIGSVSPELALIFSCLVHILHGNRPYALSRRSHNVLPLSPQGEFIYKNLIEKLLEKAKRSMKLYEKQWKTGNAYYGSIFSFDKIKSNTIDNIITSPPFIESTRFYSSNRIRLRFCGREDEFSNGHTNEFVEEVQRKNFSIYNDFLNLFYSLLKKGGKVIFHLGKTLKRDMGKEIIELVDKDKFDVLDLIEESVQGKQKHGLKDQGNTKAHQFLLLQKK